jgi:membrane associated rhomboid family serine protease
MDRLLTRLERRFGRYAPSGMIFWLVALSGVAYLLLYVRPELYLDFTLEPHSLARGELWRLLTFLFLPWSTGRTGLGPLFTLFALLFLYTIGSSLEAQWGSFRFDVFYLLAAVATIASSLLFGAVTNFYINQSLLLAFATEFPDYEIRLFLVLPLKMKWLGVLEAAFLLYQLAVGGAAERAGIVVAMSAFLLFCGPALVERFRGSSALVARRRALSPALLAFSAPEKRKPRVCARCGKSEADDPNLEFRVCDCAERCNGKLTEYCIEHARNH